MEFDFLAKNLPVSLTLQADITKNFRAVVTALELRKGIKSSQKQQQQKQQQAKPVCNFSTQSRQLHALIGQARSIVQSAQSDSESGKTTPAVEHEISRMLAACDAGLAGLTGQLGESSMAGAASAASRGGPQVLAHRREAAQILRERLQAIAAAHRAACHQRRRRARLNADFVPASVIQRRRNAPSSSAAVDQAKKLNSPPPADDPLVESLSADEKAALQQESISMLNELNALSGDVKQVESQLTEIASLQRQFGERVLEQEGQIDRIHVETVSSVENVRQGNEQLRKAMQNNASLRFWLLFYLIVTSLTLWFLDWYND